MMNCDCGTTMTKEQCEMLHDIDILGFTVTDMILYVDTHPGDKKAQDFVRHYQKLLNSLKREYAMKYGALSVSDADMYGTSWDWAAMPLPWEGGCA